MFALQKSVLTTSARSACCHRLSPRPGVVRPATRRCVQNRSSTTRVHPEHPRHNNGKEKPPIGRTHNQEGSTKEVEDIAKSVGVRLTPNELSLLRQKLDIHTDGVITKLHMDKVGQQALKEKATREICLSVVCSNANPLDAWGVRVITFFDYAGTALFAVVGTQAAGDCGMNIVGCTLVGCAAALGGGSINAMLYGGYIAPVGSTGCPMGSQPQLHVGSRPRIDCDLFWVALLLPNASGALCGKHRWLGQSQSQSSH